MDWNVVIDFLRNHYKEIIEFSVLIFSVIICLIKKRPTLNQVDVIKEDVLEILPILINKVESPGNGEEKFSNVVLLVNQYLKNKYHIQDLSFLADFIKEAIENILSTPQKKL